MPQPVHKMLENYIVDDESGCWLWQGARRPRGSLDHRPGHGMLPNGAPAHRAMWSYLVGTPIEGLELVRKASCPHWHCINPDHHEIGDQHTVGVNMVKRGTQNIPRERIAEGVRAYYAKNPKPRKDVEAMLAGRRRSVEARKAAGQPAYPNRTPETIAAALAKRAETLKRKKSCKSC